MPFFKDEALDDLANAGNVAQFVSFRPTGTGPRQSFCRIQGYSPNHQFDSAASAITALLSSSADGTINVRSFAPGSARSQEFIYGLSSVAEAQSAMDRLIGSDLCVILNETVNVSDGGVSGVVQGDLVEFAPDDTPRCVEKPGVASLPFAAAADILSKVYGFVPEFSRMPGGRLEFSIHPKPRGWKGTHTLLWERETSVDEITGGQLSWPNRFSRHLGDKAFGLLVADHLGVPVPRTLVISRRVAPFIFGYPTGSVEVWTRTCPFEPHPGLFTTVKGWTDPFALLANEDPQGKMLASVLCQSAIRAAYSGAAIVGADNKLIVEGKRGEGDRLMLGLEPPEHLPVPVIAAVQLTYERLFPALGPMRFEWVYDGSKVWIVQLHRGGTSTEAGVLVPGDATSWMRFKVGGGLEELRSALAGIQHGDGILLIGEVGLTSHVADLVRKAGKPARIAAL